MAKNEKGEYVQEDEKAIQGHSMDQMQRQVSCLLSLYLFARLYIPPSIV